MLQADPNYLNVKGLLEKDKSKPPRISQEILRL